MSLHLALQPGYPKTINDYLSEGYSITRDEAIELFGIYTLAQRIQDLKNRYIKYHGYSPILKVNLPIEGKSGTHARYFLKDCGCPLEFDGLYESV